MKLATSLAAISQLSLGVFGLVAQELAGQIRSVYVPTWNVEVTPGGPTVELKGTVQEVHAQLLKLNPNFEADFAHRRNETALEKRTDFTMARYFCNGRWGIARTEEIKLGINYLRSVPGKPISHGGPGACGRVSCSWQSAIYWCNDEPNPKELNSFGSIADGAQHVLDFCATKSTSASSVAGQVFHPTNWNVIVRYDNGNC